MTVFFLDDFFQTQSFKSYFPAFTFFPAFYTIILVTFLWISAFYTLPNTLYLIWIFCGIPQWHCNELKVICPNTFICTCSAADFLNISSVGIKGRVSFPAHTRINLIHGALIISITGIITCGLVIRSNETSGWINNLLQKTEYVSNRSVLSKCITSGFVSSTK